MKKLFHFLMLIATSAVAQNPVSVDRRFDIAVTYGVFSTPNFKDALGGRNGAADFDYYVPNSRFVLSAGLLTGSFAYFEDRRSNDPFAITIIRNSIVTNNGSLTNAENSQLHAGFQVKYRIVQTKHFVWQAGAGIGLFNQKLQYPMRDSRGTYYAESSFTDVTFPVSTEVYYRFSPRIALGIKAGAYIEPDFPIVGTNVGPQFRVRF